MFDIFAFKAAAVELQNSLPGEKVNRVFQPAPRDILISFNRPDKYNTLLISANPGNFRFHLTKEKFKQPLTPPPFCMLLRKHLQNSRILKVESVDRERILKIDFALGTNRSFLICELMGRNSNIILVDGNNIIRGALKHISPAMTRERLVSSGRDYTPPPSQRKISPSEADLDTFSKIMLPAVNNEDNESPAKKLLRFFQGVGPMQAEEVVYRAEKQLSKNDVTGAVENMWESYRELMDIYQNNQFRNFIVEKENGKKTYTVIDLELFRQNPKEAFQSTNTMLDTFYSKKVFEENRKQLKEKLNLLVKKELKKVSLKERRQQEDLKKAKKADMYRIFGETILANLGMIKGKNESITLPDIYNPGNNFLTIPLDPRYKAVDNAQIYFRKYRKLQTSKGKIKERLPATRREIRYLESVLYSLENAGMEELKEVRHELTEIGYIKVSRRKKEPKTTFRSKPMTLLTGSGYQVMVGQNNLQNDDITFKIAGRNDIWFHIQKLPGAHVVVKGAPFPPDEQTLEEAASLAAYFSKAGKTSVATVDYTLIKHVKRAPGKKPGMAIYKNFSTIHISPEKALPLLK